MLTSRKIKFFIMDLWISWWNITRLLRPAFSRARTFLWFLLVLAAFAVRNDLLGVTSFVRALGLSEHCYERLLHFFHSDAVKTERLAELWFNIVIKHFPVYMVDGRPVLILDGIKKSKEGRKMPGVKYLHQQSESNSKPQFIMGHSFQAFGVLCQVGGYCFCVPVCARIHEGIVRSNRDRRTLIDKANEMLASVCQGQQFILLADAYYANGKVIRSMRQHFCELVTRVKCSTTGWRTASVPRKRKRGRPKKYGAPVKLQNLFGTSGFSSIPSPVYGERNIVVRFKSMDLLWKPVGAMVRFVLVDHPTRGRIILLTTDLTLEAQEIILLYSLRFKIEVAFKQAVHSVGSFGYHFWMAAMRPLKRRNGNQYLHRTSEEYRRQVLRKMHAYHVFVQTGMIAQGMLQYLAMTHEDLVWKYFGTWIRTIRPDVLPSEMIVSAALKNTLPDFLHHGVKASGFRKFLLDKIDFTRSENSRFAA
jgi:DDE superfamily endonuclease